MNDTKSVKSGLSQEELDQLWAAYKKAGDEQARTKLLLHYTYLVKWIVRRMMPRYNNYNEYDDFVNTGIIGLMNAMDRFDLAHQVKFETYAVPRIRGEILDYMRAQDWAPPSLRKKISAINHAYEQLESQLQEAPSEQMVAESLDMPVAQVHKILGQSHMFNLMNFEEVLSSPYAQEDPGCADENTPEGLVMEKEQKAILAGLIDTLPEKERLVITLYYYEGLLLKDIAEIMGVTESRVSQIHSRVLTKMRARFDKAV